MEEYFENIFVLDDVLSSVYQSSRNISLCIKRLEKIISQTEANNESFRKLDTYIKLSNYAKKHNLKKVDFSDLQPKFCIRYSHSQQKLIIKNVCERDVGQIYFTEKRHALNAISEISEEKLIELLK